MSCVVIATYNIQWINISIIDEDIWYTLESGHEIWHLMNTGTIKEVEYVECHQSLRSSTQTTTSTCPTMWIDVSRSNIVVHGLITSYWCIPLTNVRSPIDNDNANKGTECNLKGKNKCVEVEHLKETINQGTLMYSHNYRWRENLPLMIVSLKELKWTLDSYSRINDMKLMEWNPLEGGN